MQLTQQPQFWIYLWPLLSRFHDDEEYEERERNVYSYSCTFLNFGWLRYLYNKPSKTSSVLLIFLYFVFALNTVCLTIYNTRQQMRIPEMLRH